MRRPLVTERYVLAEHSSNKNVREEPEDSAEAAAPSKKILPESATTRAGRKSQVKQCLCLCTADS